jgi:hypothetical protein
MCAKNIASNEQYSPAEELHAKIKKSSVFEVQESISEHQAIQNVIKHLDMLCTKHVKKSYSRDYIVGQIFGRRSYITDPEAKTSYYRAALLAATGEFKDLISSICGSNSEIRFENLAENREILISYIFDLKPLAEFFGRRDDKEYWFFRGERNYGIRSLEVFNFSRQLTSRELRAEKISGLDFRSCQIAAVFVLRQALEAKFERIVATYLHNKHGEIPRVRHTFHYDFIRKNPRFFHFRAANLGQIIKVYEWCNQVVHRVYLPSTWKIALAQRVCGELFLPLEPRSGTRMSIENAVEIHDLQGMRDAFADYFINETKHHEGQVWCMDPYPPEALLV